MFSPGINSPVNSFVFHFADNSDATYDYICYFSMKGDCLIARVKKDNTEQLFALIKYEEDPYNNIWLTGQYRNLEYKKIYELR